MVDEISDTSQRLRGMDMWPGMDYVARWAELSAFAGKADVERDPSECLLMTQSGHP